MLINRDPNKGASQDGDPKDPRVSQANASLPREVMDALGSGPVVQPQAAASTVERTAQAAAPTAERTAQTAQVIPPAVPVGASVDTTLVLISLIEKLNQSIQLQTEVAQRAGRKDLEDEIRLKTKRDAYARNRGDESATVLRKQAQCDHLKGGKYKFRDKEDYAVYFHRFIDNTMFIRCMLCKMKWYNTDTAEVIFRGGEARPNHTGIGWAEAAKMCFKKSTNQLSQSEIPAETQMRVQRKEDIPDTLGVITR